MPSYFIIDVPPSQTDALSTRVVMRLINAFAFLEPPDLPTEHFKIYPVHPIAEGYSAYCVGHWHKQNFRIDLAFVRKTGVPNYKYQKIISSIPLPALLNYFEKQVREEFKVILLGKFCQYGDADPSRVALYTSEFTTDNSFCLSDAALSDSNYITKMRIIEDICSVSKEIARLKLQGKSLCFVGEPTVFLERRITLRTLLTKAVESEYSEPSLQAVVKAADILLLMLTESDLQAQLQQLMQQLRQLLPEVINEKQQREDEILQDPPQPLPNQVEKQDEKGPQENLQDQLNTVVEAKYSSYLVLFAKKVNSGCPNLRERVLQNQDIRAVKKLYERESALTNSNNNSPCSEPDQGEEIIEAIEELKNINFHRRPQ